MSERTLRVHYMNYYPFVSECSRLPRLRSHKGCLLPGMFVEFLDIFAKNLNLTIEATQINPTMSFDAYLKLLINGTVDLYATTVEKSLIYDNEGLELSYPIYYSTTKIIVRRAEDSSENIFDLFMVYDSFIWAALGIIFVVFGVMGVVMRLMERHLRFRSTIDVDDVIWRLARMKFMQSEGVGYYSISGNFSLVLFAFLHCGLVIRMYNNLVTSSTVREVNPIPFQSNELPSVIKEKRYSLIAAKPEDWWVQEVFNKTSSPFYELRMATENNKITMANDMVGNGKVQGDIRVLDEVNRGGKVSFLQTDQLPAFLAEDYCDLVYLDSILPRKPHCLLMRRDHPLLPEINKIILQEYVFFVRIYNKYITTKKRSKCKERRGPTALPLQPYYSVISLYLLGVLLGIFVFFYELVFK